ncbi:MAG: exonuclease domain-containing protein [Myxococcota bacterium]
MKRPQDTLRPVSDDLYAISGLEIEALGSLRFWLFDLEATGLDTRRERITQIAGIPLEEGRLVESQAFSSYVNPGPGAEISREVQELTGITPEMLADAPTLPEAWQACLRAAAGSDLWLGQSVFEYDVPLLETEFERHGIETPLPPILDSVVLATALLGPPRNRWSTSALLHHYSVSTDGLRRHDALDDVRILGRILVPMLEQYRRERDDRLVIPSGRALEIKRHPPVH